ncbi:hypothetical protein BZA77DRAFT_315811 [Pyronema omphalodes]|nr:hypothetical protein BZA77DRAFT_315811 [Pyronema omphalodes]
MQTPLVDYPDTSDSDSEPEATPPAKKLKIKSELSTSATIATVVTPPSLPSVSPLPQLPPLPARFHNLYAVAPRIGKEDDPTLHGGRKRAIPHVQGNWPTFAFIEWFLESVEFDTLERIYEIAKKASRTSQISGLFQTTIAQTSQADTEFKLESHLKSDLGAELPLHLSLSRPNVLRTEQREGFLEMVTERVGRIKMKPFPVTFNGTMWASNWDKTRWFLVLKATVGKGKELPKLLDLMNRAFAVFKQPPLVTPGGGLDGFHVSLAWSLTEPSSEAKRAIEEALEKAGYGSEIKVKDQQDPLKMEVKEIKVKIGNVVHIIELGTDGTGAQINGAAESRVGKRKASI